MNNQTENSSSILFSERICHNKGSCTVLDIQFQNVVLLCLLVGIAYKKK